jgi:hypothetical protein
MDDLIAFITARLDEDEADIDTRDHDSGQCDYLRGVHLEPERALREVAAKRAILKQYQDSRNLLSKQETYDLVRAGVAALRVAVMFLATVWSDHPDYRQEWAP